MGNTKNSAGKRVFNDVYSFPQDSQDLADDIFANANVRVGTSADRQALPVAQRRIGMIWVETDTNIPYMDAAGSGWVPLGAKFVGIKARRAAPQSCATGVFTTLSWDTENFDIGNFRAPAAPTDLVAPVTGVYQVNATGGFTNAISGRVGIQFLKNGAIEYGGNMIPAGGSDDISAQASTLVQMNASDVLRVQIFQQSGSSQNTSTSAYTMPTVTLQLEGGM